MVAGARGSRWDRRAAGRGALGAAGLLAAGAASAVGAPSALAQQGVVEDELRVITYELFTSLDAVDDYSPEYLRSVGLGETLLRVTPRGEVDVDLARAFEWTEPQTLRVDLRPEATFWSGAPVTAGAVQAGMERLRRLVPFAASLLRGVQIEATDDWTLTFRADGPAPGLPLALASEYLYVHNAGAFPADAKASAADWRSADLTGFFRVTQFEPKTRAVLERNERYWGVRPRMARIRIDEVPDINTRTLAALSGEAHVVRWISTQGARQVDRSRDMRAVLPQVIGPVVVLAALDLGALLLAISALSFLGLGAQPPTPEWGAMLAEGRRSFLEYQHLMLFPGGAIFLAALAFSLLGEGTRDLLDPRGAGRRL